MFDCVLENTIENTFSTCCPHFLTFSWLPNEYIISFIPQNTNKTQEKIIKSGQMKARSRSARVREASIVIAIDANRRGVWIVLSLSLSRCVCSLTVFCCVLFAEFVSLFCACYGKCFHVFGCISKNVSENIF